ncbi:lysophospholipase L1-like esterase [Arthrobacter ginsengisoli]|uniref:Lysophospholipase L1-like esterase n=1 Tax=Arthrobacter ginsengisoli TaxID=1356565 RepID=A0ABU1U8E7_9MICC|nr:GDSL-type esterase/lipase family protein [Arthrobacter ginsengisoli]MDR7081448.1 lysophospholipase L1-like esterase [Arthrobacter ginsengisoli]
MPRRIISVDDTFNVPDSVKINDANLPARLADAALNATIGEQVWPKLDKTAVGFGTKVGAFSFGGGGGASATTSVSEMIVRTPFRLPVKPTRARLHVQNRNLKDNLGLTPGAFAFTGLWIGKPVLDSVGGLTANFTAAPTNVIGAFSTPADGSEYVSAWFDTSAIIDAKTDYALSYGYTCTAGQSTHRATGFHWWSNITGDAAKANLQNMVGTVTTNQSPHLDIWLEYEFAATNPVNLHVGDSLTDGQMAIYGARDSYPQQFSRRTGAVAATLAFSGSSLSPGWDITSPKYGKYAGLVFDAMYVHLGTNDINAGASLATVQTRLGIALDKLRTTYGNVPVYLGIVPPRNFGAGPEAVRVAYNTWLRTLPFGVTGTMDFDRAVRSAADLKLIDADFNGGDGTHMSTAGYDKFAQAVPLRTSV